MDVKLTDDVTRIAKDCAVEGWDTYGALPVTEVATKRALDLAVGIENAWIGPTVYGGYEVEIECGSLTVFITIDREGSIEATVCD